MIVVRPSPRSKQARVLLVRISAPYAALLPKAGLAPLSYLLTRCLTAIFPQLCGIFNKAVRRPLLQSAV